MKKTRFSEAQTVGIFKEFELGATFGVTHRKNGISDSDATQVEQQAGVDEPVLSSTALVTEQ